MSKVSRRDFLKLAGASVAVAVSGEALAEENPFGFKTLQAGYQQAAADQNNGNMNQMNGGAGNSMQNDDAKKYPMKNGTGTCGAAVMKQHNGNCGAATPPPPKQPKEGKCGGGNSMQ